MRTRTTDTSKACVAASGPGLVPLSAGGDNHAIATVIIISYFFQLNLLLSPRFSQVPESEGGNAAYCSVQMGLNHCLTGTRPAGHRPEPRPARDDSVWSGSLRAAIRDEWVPALAASGAALRARPGAALPPPLAAVQLRVMDPRSLLVVGKASVVYERSFSGRVRVRLNSDPSSPFESSVQFLGVLPPSDVG